ncbi:PilW family protein [Patescibacteria group bacterium]
MIKRNNPKNIDSFFAAKEEKEKKFSTGFSLIELLIYTAVFSIVILAISSFVLWSIRCSGKNKAMIETLDNARRAMETITYEIKEARDVYVPITTVNQLSLETAKYLPTDENTSYVDFYICGDRLCLKKESQSPIALTSDNVEVGNLVFNRIVTGGRISIQVDLQIDYKNPGGEPEYDASTSLTSTISLRSD